MAEHYDVIIIGTGAGGGTLAHALAGSGKRILLLERGDFLPRETQNWDPRPVFVDGRYISSNTVKSHIKHICHKLAATHRGEAVRRARQLQLI